MENRLSLIVGTKRTGKTTLARGLLACGSNPRVVVVDSTGEDYTEFPTTTRLNLATTLCAKKETGKFRFRLIPNCKEDFEFVLSCVLAVDNVLLVVDEASFFMSAVTYPDVLSKLIRLGGHWQQDLIFITQAPPDFPKLMRRQCDEIFFFGMTEEADVEWARHYIGDEADKLPRLPKFDYLKYTKGSIDITYGHGKIVDEADEILNKHMGGDFL